MQRQTTCLVHLQTIPKWLQSGETFKKICDTWGTPDIDHFSNRLYVLHGSQIQDLPLLMHFQKIRNNLLISTAFFHLA